MLTEEALILLATLMASGLLVLGVMELVWPTTSRRPARRARLTRPTREAVVAPSEAFRAPRESAPREMPSPPAPVEHIEPDIEAAPAVEAAPPVPAAVEALPPANAPEPVAAPTPPRRPAPTPRSGRTPRSSDWRSAEASEPAVVERPLPIAASVSALPATAEPAVVPPVEPVAAAESSTRRESKPSVLPIDTCLAMYRERRFGEVVSLGSAALEVNAHMASVSERHDEAAALFDLVGLSKQELGDRDGACAAFRAAVRGAEPQVRPTYVRHLITLVRSVVDPIVAAGAMAEDDEAAAQVRELRACVVALEDALGVVPGDEGLGSASAAVREALSSACERLVGARRVRGRRRSGTRARARGARRRGDAHGLARAPARAADRRVERGDRPADRARHPQRPGRQGRRGACRPRACRAPVGGAAERLRRG